MRGTVDASIEGLSDNYEDRPSCRVADCADDGLALDNSHKDQMVVGVQRRFLTRRAFRWKPTWFN